MTREKLLFLHAEQLCREQPFLGSMISWSTDWKVISHFGRMFCKIHLETWCDSTGATNRDPIALTISWAWLGGVPILGSLPKIIIAIDGRNCRQTSLLVLSIKTFPDCELDSPWHCGLFSQPRSDFHQPSTEILCNTQHQGIKNLVFYNGNLTLLRLSKR